MKPRINFITIPTNDLKKSFAFYRDGLGLSTKGIDRKSNTSELQSPCNLVCRLLLEKKDTDATGTNTMTEGWPATLDFPGGGSHLLAMIGDGSNYDIALESVTHPTDRHHSAVPFEH